jgi:hypothetical protein
MFLKGSMMSVRKRLLAVAAAAVTMWAVIQPGTVSAQTSGVGQDGYTRFLWKGTDYSISLWQLDPSLNFYNYHLYGPYNGWDPIALTTAHNNNSYVLWRYYDGTITVWSVDTLLNYITQKNYGPYTGWSAKGLSVDTGTGSGFRIIWRHTGGSVAVWQLDQNLNYVNSKNYGPYFGYDPGYTYP